MAFSDAQLHSIVIAERVASSLSLLGTVFIMTTFISTPHFRKPINRLVFYASIGNAFLGVGTLISREGIKRGSDSPLCQFQAFVLQMFALADVLWSLAMAVNVYLVVFRRFDADDLQKLEKRYMVGCYGLPFILAFVFLFVKDRARGKMYGNATLWCWISVKWEIVRIACFYAPIWTLALVIITIYILVGIEIWRGRRRLRKFQQFRPTQTSLPSIPLTSRRNVVSKPLGDEGHLRHYISTSTNYNFGTAILDNFRDALSLNASTSSLTRQPPYSPKPYHYGSRQDDHTSFALRNYIGTSLLFFVILFITWVPSSFNRVYSLVSPDNRLSYPLGLLSSIVLPLQGFWNAVVFTVIGIRGWKER